MEHIKQISALAEMFPAGQKINAAIVEYDTPIRSCSLSVDQFAVQDRQIVRIYANDQPCTAKEGKDGPFVIIELAINCSEASILVQPPKEEGEKRHKPKYMRAPSVSVAQLSAIKAADGSDIASTDGFMSSTNAVEPVAEDFQHLVFDGLKYYLYVPKQYDSNKKYPLVLFMTDMGGNSEHDKLALSQGIGGTIWATPEEQAKHPCFVLVPQFPRMQVVFDDFTYDPIYFKVKQLLDHVIEQYSIDMDRIYTTGQSQGCMASCQLNVDYPDFFAASLLVVGQWNPETMGKTCSHHNYWILVSEQDTKAYPGMTDVTNALSANGAVVKKSYWDAKASKEQMAENVKQALAEQANVRFTCLIGDSVLPPEEDGPDRPRHAHAATWPVVYNIEGVRDWLFSCTRPHK